MTTAQLRALYAAAALVLRLDMMKAGDKFDLQHAMRGIAGPQWRRSLGRGFAELSRGLARKTFTKKRRK